MGREHCRGPRLCAAIERALPGAPLAAGVGDDWQNRRFAGTTSFVVELPPGPLPRAAARRHAFAILTLD